MFNRNTPSNVLETLLTGTPSLLNKGSGKLLLVFTAVYGKLCVINMKKVPITKAIIKTPTYVAIEKNRVMGCISRQNRAVALHLSC